MTNRLAAVLAITAAALLTGCGAAADAAQPAPTPTATATTNPATKSFKTQTPLPLVDEGTAPAPTKPPAAAPPLHVQAPAWHPPAVNQPNIAPARPAQPARPTIPAQPPAAAPKPAPPAPPAHAQHDKVKRIPCSQLKLGDGGTTVHHNCIKGK